MYLNKFNFINGAYGIESASEIYFNKPQDSLHFEEAAVLVGMLKNPSLYNPVRRPDMVVERRNTVIAQAVKYDKVPREVGDSLMALPLDMTGFNRKSHVTGPAPYFRQVVSMKVRSILNQEAYLKTDGTNYNIFKDGLKIYTTIDTTIQRLAEEAIQDHMPSVQEKLWRTWKGKDPWTYRDHETTQYELDIRKRSLQKLIRESDRYRKIVIKRTISDIDALDQTFGIAIKDYDMKSKQIVRSYT
jgi:penicillin-binding protein 1A